MQDSDDDGGSEREVSRPRKRQAVGRRRVSSDSEPEQPEAAAGSDSEERETDAAQAPLTVPAAPPADGDCDSDSDKSLVDFLMTGRDEGCSDIPSRVRKDFQSVSDALRNKGPRACDLEFRPYMDPYRLLYPSPDAVGTMDAVHKCLQIIPEGDPSLLTQPCDGYTWAFAARCIGSSVPEHIEKALYFFYRVLSAIESQGYTHFAIPTANLVPQWDRQTKKSLIAVAERQERVAEDRPAPEGDGFGAAFSLSSVVRGRTANMEGDQLNVKAPFALRMGFTGSFFREGAQKHQELYCVLFVTPLRNFDLLSYITESFLAKPKPGSTEFRTRHAEWAEFTFIWKTLLQYEIHENMRIPCGVCDPLDHSLDPGGELGVDTVLGMFMLPLKIHEIIRHRFPQASEVRIVGFPELSFRDQDDMTAYSDYMHAYIDHNVRWRTYFSSQVEIYNRCKEEARQGFMSNLNNPGGWPLYSVVKSGRREFKHFGLPPLPIVMWWSLQKSPVHYLSFDAFKLNTGKLPQLVLVQLRKFLTFDGDSDMSLQLQDSIMLTDRQPVTPYAVSMRYYSDQANPLESLATAGCLMQWWIAIKEYVQRQRGADQLSPEAAMDVLWRYLGSCMESHRGMIISGQFRSTRVKQALEIIEKAPSSGLGALKLAPLVRRMAAKVSESIRHDPYLRMSAIFFHLFEDLNKDFVLNAANLEFLIEMNISSMHWLVGAHNATFKWFFQVVSGNGHYLVSLKDFTARDTRKPNSTGVDFAVDKANKQHYMLGEYVGISKADNRQVFVNANRWTPVGLENQGCVEIVDNNIMGYPSPELCMRPVVATEMRNADLCSVIKNVYPRNSDQQVIMLNTVDLKNTNQRSLSVKHQVDRPNFSGKCTNCLPGDKIKDEEFKTVQAVIHLMVPGSPAYVRSDPAATGFNNIHCDKNQSRDRVPDEPRRAMLTKMLSFSHVFAACLVALPNRSGIMPFEISEPVLAYLDWLFLYIRNHCSCVLDIDVQESFNRIKASEGYESRHVVYTIWRTAMLALSEDLDPTQAAMRCIMALNLSALAVTEVPAAAHSFLTRGVHAGSLIMTCVLIQELAVPIVPIDDLCDFFASDQVSI